MGSGIDTSLIESGAYTSAALRGIYGGKAYKRAIEYHITTCLAIMMMRYDAMFSIMPSGPLQVQCHDLKTALHDRNPEMSGLADNIQSLHPEAHRKPDEKDEGDLHAFSSSTSTRLKVFWLSSLPVDQVTGKDAWLLWRTTSNISLHMISSIMCVSCQSTWLR